MLAFFRANVGATANTTYNKNFDTRFALPPVVTSVTRVERGFTPSPAESVTKAFDDFNPDIDTNYCGVFGRSCGGTVTATVNTVSGHKRYSLNRAEVCLIPNQRGSPMRVRTIPLFLLTLLFVFTFPVPANAQTSVAGSASQPTHTVRIDFNQRVRMRAGVELSADVYRPDADGRFPVILNRTPYTKTGALSGGRYYAARGYVYVAMDVRGRGDSDGKFVPYRNDGRDGYDAIEWSAVQPWSTGKIGTIGGSYNGRIQWLAAVEQSPHLTTMIALVLMS